MWATPPQTDTVSWPTDMHTVSMAYGARFTAGGRTRTHDAVDFPAPCNAPVWAVTGGRITRTSRNDGVYGNQVVLSAGGTTYSYSHLSTMQVRKGDVVKPHQRIGTVGATGRVTGCNLHFQVRRGGRTINPISILPRTKATAAKPKSKAATARKQAPAVRRTPLSPASFRPNMSGQPRLGWPTDVRTVSSPYGPRHDPFTGRLGTHSGTDFAAPCGAAIHSIASGVVTSTTHGDPIYGNRVRVKHNARITSTYSHMMSVGVGVGDKVARGSKLGTVGATGTATGCHLHLQLIVDGAFVNPFPNLR